MASWLANTNVYTYRSNNHLNSILANAKIANNIWQPISTNADNILAIVSATQPIPIIANKFKLVWTNVSKAQINMHNYQWHVLINIHKCQ
jgi:hypothetical protein